MAADIVVSDVKIRFRGEKGGPLLGWASCVLNGGVLINSIEIAQVVCVVQVPIEIAFISTHSE